LATARLDVTDEFISEVLKTMERKPIKVMVNESVHQSIPLAVAITDFPILTLQCVELSASVAACKTLG